MSFDLAVWNSDFSTAARRAPAIYDALCKGACASQLTPSPNVTEFYNDLMAMWPESDFVKLDHSERHVLVSCEWSKAEEVYILVRELARTHGLVFFDPQSDEVTLPE
jgi:hypothetical protein